MKSVLRAVGVTIPATALVTYALLAWLGKLSEPTGIFVAAWVQAIGSILAIAGAFIVTRWQLAAQEKSRYNDNVEDQIRYVQGLRALTIHTNFPIDDLANAIKDPSTDWNVVDEKLLTESLDAYEKFPLHRLHSSDLISGTISFRIRLRRLSCFISGMRRSETPRYSEAFEEPQRAKEMSDKYVHLCDDEIKKLRSSLR